MMDLKSFIRSNLKNEKKYIYSVTEFRTFKKSFPDIYELASRCANLIRHKGLKKGDAVILKSKNSIEWVIAYLACLISGIVIVPVDDHSSIKFLDKIKVKVKAKLVLVQGIPEDRKDDGIYPLGKFVEDCKKYPVYEESGTGHSPEDIAEIIFTSGTTDEPKGVMLTYKNIWANIRSAMPVIKKWQGFLKLIPNPKVLSLVPLSHMYGQVAGIFLPLITDMSVVFSYTNKPGVISRLIKEEGIWVLSSLPRILEELKEYFIRSLKLDTEGFSRKYFRFKNKRWWKRLAAFWPLHVKIGWRLVSIISGGAKMEPGVEEFFRCIAYSVFQGYGLTETAPLLTLTDPAKNKLGSIGDFLEKKDIKIENGEILVKGDNVTPGYYMDKDSTRKAFAGEWFKTGDLVELDKSGDVFFVGRKDDLIVRRDGLNIYPADIEAKLKKDMLVKDCVVVSYRQGKRDIITAVIIPKEKQKAKNGISRVISRVNKDLAAYQKIKEYHLWPYEDFPRTPTLKIKRSSILKWIKDSKCLPDKDEGQVKRDLKDIFKKYSGKTGRVKDLSLGKDLGMDSLDIISFTTELEQNYGLDPDSMMLDADMKIRDVERILKNPLNNRSDIPFYRFTFSKLLIPVRTLFQFFLYPFIRVLYRCSVRGIQGLDEEGNPVAFASNHVSMMDSIVILYSLPMKLRIKTSVVMSINHHFSNFFDKKANIILRIIEAILFFMLSILIVNVIPISRKQGFSQVFKNIGDAIDMGWNILLFPEGSVTVDGQIKDFEPGIGIISKDMRTPVVPIRIEGLFNILRNGLLPWGHLPGRPEVVVKFGKKILLSDGSYKEISKSIEKKVRGL